MAKGKYKDTRHATVLIAHVHWKILRGLKHVILVTGKVDMAPAPIIWAFRK